MVAAEPRRAPGRVKRSGGDADEVQCTAKLAEWTPMSSGSFLSPGAGRDARCAAPLAALGFFLALAAGVSGADAAVSPALDARIAATAPGHEIAVIATFADQVPDARYTGRPAALVQALQRRADTSQADVADHRGRPGEELLARQRGRLLGHARRDPPGRRRPRGRRRRSRHRRAHRRRRHRRSTSPSRTPARATGASHASNVPAVWSAYGLVRRRRDRGDHRHGRHAPRTPTSSARSPPGTTSWATRPRPRDDNGHGTHTAGTIVGGSAGGAAIGVAPRPAWWWPRP